MTASAAQDIGLDIFRFLPPRERLMELAAARKAEYAAAKPFPHIGFDDFLPADAAEAVLDAFPTPQGVSWREFRNERERKLATGDERVFPPVVRNVLAALNSLTFLKFLEELTGIPNLIPDPHFLGGGLHQIVAGGKLGVHVDFNLHTHYRLDRRLNLLVYLNKDWREEYGGHFELWNADGTRCEKKFLPVFNRCVIFSTSEISYHGHPHPLTCPPDRTRKSLALYYYTNGRPDGETAPEHSTVFRDLPEENTPGRRLLRGFRRVVRAVTPPVLYGLVDRKA